MTSVRWRLVSLHRSHRYAILFYVLLGTLAASPLLTALGFSTDLLQIILAFSLLVALTEVPGRGRMVLVLVAAVAVGLRIVPASTVGADVSSAALAAVSGLALFAAVKTIRFALGAREIDAERIYAALSAYVLAGLFFGVLYWEIEVARPGSFGEAGADGARGPFSLSTAIYFSFVTLATLGYGDVVPRTEFARGIAILEAVGGQLYIAVTIARLVSASRQPSRSGGEDGGR